MWFDMGRGRPAGFSGHVEMAPVSPSRHLDVIIECRTITQTVPFSTPEEVPRSRSRFQPFKPGSYCVYDAAALRPSLHSLPITMSTSPKSP